MLSTDNKKELEKRSKELCRENSPTKRKSAATRSPAKKPKTSAKVQGKKSKKRPAGKNLKKLTGTASKKQQRLAELHRAHKEAEWMFGQESSGEESSVSQWCGACQFDTVTLPTWRLVPMEIL